MIKVKLVDGILAPATLVWRERFSAIDEDFAHLDGQRFEVKGLHVESGGKLLVVVETEDGSSVSAYLDEVALKEGEA